MKLKNLKISLFLLLSISVFKTVEKFENNKNEKIENKISSTKAEILTFNPQKLVEELDEINEEQKVLKEYFEKESQNLQAEIDGVNDRKKVLNKEIKEKGASLNEDVIKQQSMDIFNAEREIYQKQVALQNSFGQRMSDLSAKAKSLIDGGLETYIKKNENAVILPVEYLQNKKFDITDDLIKICNENYKKTKNVNKKKEENSKEKSDKKVEPIKAAVKA